MFSGKTAVLGEVEKILEGAGFEILEYENSCFDIIAKKDIGGSKMLFLKVLLNIDSLQKDHAKNMRIISNATGSFSGVIGIQTRYERMDDHVVYERFGIAAFTPGLLEKMVVYQQFPFLFRDRGGLYAKVSHETLKKAREERGLTQETLAKKIGVSKKSVYEHEKKDMRMLLPQAKKFNRILDENVMSQFGFESWKYDERGEPKTAVEKEVFSCFSKIGMEPSCVHKSPFNVIAREKQALFAHAESRLPSRKTSEELKNLSKIAKGHVLVVAEEECKDLPSIKRKKLKKLSNKEELFDIIKKF